MQSAQMCVVGFQLCIDTFSTHSQSFSHQRLPISDDMEKPGDVHMCAKLFWMGSNKLFRSNFQDFTTMALQQSKNNGIQWRQVVIMQYWFYIQDIMGERSVLYFYFHIIIRQFKRFNDENRIMNRPPLHCRLYMQGHFHV